MKEVVGETPDGTVHFGETREKAIKREVKKEFGDEIEIIKTLQVADEILPKDKQHWVSTAFICRIKGSAKGRSSSGRKEPKIMEPDKSEAIGWFSLDNLPKPLSFITKLDIKAYKKKCGTR